MTLPIATAPAPCVMCGDLPRHRPPGTSPLLCGSLLCAHRYAALPVFAKCKICLRPIAAPRWGIGACERIACITALEPTHSHAGAAAIAKARLKRATALRNRHAAKRGMSPEERSSFRVAVLPRNLEQLSVLPAHRREAFEQHLRAVLAVAHADTNTDPPQSFVAREDGRPQAERDAEEELLGAGCASCRGHCCRKGEDHAFITADTLRGYRLRFPDHDDETIIASYLGRIGEETITHGCIFQHELGCTLVREQRSYTCNAYFCAGIRAVRGHFEPGAPVRAFFVHQRDGRLSGGQFVDITVRRHHDIPSD